MGPERIELPNGGLEPPSLPLAYGPLLCNSLWQLAHSNIHLFASFKTFCLDTSFINTLK